MLNICKVVYTSAVSNFDTQIFSTLQLNTVEYH